MKHIILILILVTGFGAIQAQQNKTKREKRKAKKEAAYAMKVKKVKDLIDQKAYKFIATQMLPSGAPGNHISYGYDLTINDNEVICYLPYLGRAYTADLSGKGPYNFENKIENYSIKRSKKGYLIKFEARNKSDNISFVLDVELNGSSSLRVYSDNRQGISYLGDIGEIEEKPE